MKGLWAKMSGRVRIGLIVGLIGALLTVVGLFLGDFAPLTVRSLVLGIVLGGGSWGVVSWAIASATDDAVREGEE
jgi:hypothetical protein